MVPKKIDSDAEGRRRVVAEARRAQAEREKGYRARALKMYPWVCGHCGREFSGKKLRELEVHHKDHNHDNNPPDGSNWELLCMYCHENQHARHDVASVYRDEPSSDGNSERPSIYQPFAGLADFLNKDKQQGWDAILQGKLFSSSKPTEDTSD